MQIRRLRLSGFKSFVEPAELRIENGLTGVVGPNGCGKSNLLEAIRWVMAESSAKSLRGGGMEDVIFSGTQRRPPRDFAEVSLLTHDDAGEEMEIVRRIERGAGSAYRLNGRDVRARDIGLLFADAATGAHSPALVSQGRIARIIAAKPAERRQMLEEAAGIAGLHLRRREAETRLRQTEANLAELDRLLASADERLAQLRRQARQAERYRELSEAIRTAEAQLIFVRWRDAARAADEAAGAASEAAEAVALAQRAATDSAAELRAAGRRIDQARDDAAALRRESAALDTERERGAARLAATRARLRDLELQHRHLAEDGEAATRLLAEADEARARLAQQIASQTGAAERVAAQRPAMADRVAEAERAMAAADTQVAHATAGAAEAAGQWRVFTAEREALAARLARAEGERTRQNAALARLPDADARQAEARAATTMLEQARARRDEATRELAQAQAARNAAAQNNDTVQLALTEAAARHRAAAAEAQALAKDIAAATKDDTNLPTAIVSLRVRPGYERAVAAVLGEDSEAPLDPDGTVRAGRAWTGAPPPPPVPGSLLAYLDRCPEILRARMAAVRVVPADTGQRLAQGEWLVTLEGDLRRWDGLVSRGEGNAAAARLVAVNWAAQLAGLLPDLSERLSAAQAEAARAGAALTAAQDRARRAQAALDAAAAAEHGAHRSASQAEEALERLSRERRAFEEAAGRADAEQTEAASLLAEVERRAAALPDRAGAEHALAEARRTAETARRAVGEARDALHASDQDHANLLAQIARAAGEAAGWEARARDAGKRHEGLAGRLEELRSEIAIEQARLPGLETMAGELETRAQALAARMEAADAALTAQQAAASHAEAAAETAQATLLKASEKRAALAATAESEALRRVEMGRIASERFGCPAAQLPARAGFDADRTGTVADASAQLDRLTAQRERLGPVNLVAATQLADELAQHEDTVRDRHELVEAVHRLRGSVGTLNREGRERLRTAFEQVDGHFRQLFGELFGGGEARLALIDSDDPLEAGLEIFAQPPGKRLQSLTLLSGGEQALTSIALVFALFLAKPAPICVLDEVDAPLDDANIDRFCDLLDAMTRRTDTRYLVVTHNAVTMSRMHRLFGVTMTEPGVSRLVSVDLSSAEVLLAAE